MKCADWVGLGVVATILAGLVLFRRGYVEPREWAKLCAAAAPPLSCLPRAEMLWLQRWYLWGIGALLLWLGVFLHGQPIVAVAAVALWAVEVTN
ncbi:MAG TPA: hypothetical protein VNW90_01315 [Acetobacteraceae bacterium]|jgi:hypothetical protein|nr:hypothetical protein [Acetobacteraceae bacterium]